MQGYNHERGGHVRRGRQAQRSGGVGAVPPHVRQRPDDASLRVYTARVSSAHKPPLQQPAACMHARSSLSTHR